MDTCPDLGYTLGVSIDVAAFTDLNDDRRRFLAQGCRNVVATNERPLRRSPSTFVALDTQPTMKEFDQLWCLPAIRGRSPHFVEPRKLDHLTEPQAAVPAGERRIALVTPAPAAASYDARFARLTGWAAVHDPGDVGRVALRTACLGRVACDAANGSGLESDGRSPHF